MLCLEQAGCVPWRSQGFCRCLFLRVKTGCFLRVKTRYRAFEGSEVAGRRPGQVAGNPAARSRGSPPCLGAVLPSGPQALRLPRADPGVLGTARPARPLPTRREPPVTCRRCWATAPLAPQPPQPRLPLRLPPRPPLPGDQGQHRAARSEPRGPALLLPRGTGEGNPRLGMLRSSHPKPA